MVNRNLNKEITRQALTAEEAAFALHTDADEFVRRFVATKKILPVIYDAECKTPLYDFDDVRMLIKTSRKEFPEWFYQRLQKGESISSIMKELKEAA